jgi:Tfp pilus assembly protein PilN
VAPREQLEAAVTAAARRQQRVGRSTSVLQVLRELSIRVPPGLQLDLDELSVERETILLHGRCESFDGVDSLRRALGASPLLADATAEETRATVDGRRVEFRLRATRRPTPGASS